jgi:GT2 family glycosyltransferase
MKISIIIPTHNRADQLKVAIDSIATLRNEADFELVIVDNNSADATREVVRSYGDVAKYVFEGRTAFTRARATGAESATGDILLYLDDDVIVNSGSLRRIREIFEENPDCGVIAGKILPMFVEEPPGWVLECQKSFNGWSLYSTETYPSLREEFQEVSSAAGPMMAVRRDVYMRVGGFPPDTVGVETNRQEKSFNKLYIGPGDYGLCCRVREAGFKIYYHPNVSVYHVIPPIRFTVSFWRSRMIGEGYYQAISQRGFWQLNKAELFRERVRAKKHFYKSERELVARLGPRRTYGGASASFEGVFPEELWVRYYKAYLDMDWVLRRYPELWKLLWEIGYEGVDSHNFDYVMARLPAEYKELVSNDFVYDATPLDSIEAYNTSVRSKGYYRYKSKVAMDVFTLAFDGTRFLYHLIRKLARPLPAKADVGQGSRTGNSSRHGRATNG